MKEFQEVGATRRSRVTYVLIQLLPNELYLMVLFLFAGNSNITICNTHLFLIIMIMVNVHCLSLPS